MGQIFSGTGTSVLVAVQQGRRAVGMGVGPEYTVTVTRRMLDYLGVA